MMQVIHDYKTIVEAKPVDRHSREGGNLVPASTLDSRLRGNDGLLIGLTHRLKKLVKCFYD